MEQRISLITLGVADLRRATDFYAAMGWQGGSPDGDVAFFQAGCMVLALWDRAKLADDSGVTDSGGWGGVTLAHNVRSPAEVDAVIAEVEPAGGTVARPAPRRPGAATPAPSSIRTVTRGRSRTTRTGRSATTAASRCRDPARGGPPPGGPPVDPCPQPKKASARTTRSPRNVLVTHRDLTAELLTQTPRTRNHSGVAAVALVGARTVTRAGAAAASGACGAARFSRHSREPLRPAAALQSLPPAA